MKNHIDKWKISTAETTKMEYLWENGTGFCSLCCNDNCSVVVEGDIDGNDTVESIQLCFECIKKLNDLIEER